MRIVSNREGTAITLSECHCFNLDSVIELSIILAAREYWEVQGHIQYQTYTNQSHEHWSLNTHRDYQRMKAALNRFDNLSERDLEGMRYSGCMNERRKYFNGVQTLFDLKGYMWY